MYVFSNLINVLVQLFNENKRVKTLQFSIYRERVLVDSWFCAAMVLDGDRRKYGSMQKRSLG